MELVRVLPSAEDEVNVACFHPLVGGGLVYGTKVKIFFSRVLQKFFPLWTAYMFSWQSAGGQA